MDFRQDLLDIIIYKLEKKSSKKLTRRERDVLSLQFQFHSGKEIAEILVISIKTLDAHKQNIREKLELRRSPIYLHVMFSEYYKLLGVWEFFENIVKEKPELVTDTVVEVFTRAD